MSATQSEQPTRNGSGFVLTGTCPHWGAPAARKTKGFLDAAPRAAELK
jgi:hypothetical protein